MIAGAEVNVHETVVDAVVLHMKKVVVGMKVVSARVLRLLGVSELVVDAVLNDESVERSRNETKDDSGREFHQQEEELLRHSVAVNMSVKSQGSMQVVVEFVGVLVNLRKMSHPVLGVEQLGPVGNSVRDNIGEFQGEPCSIVKKPDNNRDRKPRVHHVSCKSWC